MATGAGRTTRRWQAADDLDMREAIGSWRTRVAHGV
jgi:hypothetical protein